MKRHILYTGVSNQLILKNLKIINDMDAKIRVRCIIVNGINTEEIHYGKVADIAKSLKNFDGVEIIPYHAYGGSKAVFVGKKDNGRKDWVPDKEQIDAAKEFFEALDIKIR